MSEGLPEVAPVHLHASGISRIRHWMRRVLGVDRAIGFTVLARFWSSAAGLVTVALIARFLSPAEQGYYYTFGSLVAVQIVFELGFSYEILQLASHERAELSISIDYEISGAPIAHARLASVIQKSVRRYSVAAVIMAGALLPLGFYFFSTHQHAGQSVSWQLPWFSAALMAALNFQLDPFRPQRLAGKLGGQHRLRGATAARGVGQRRDAQSAQQVEHARATLGVHSAHRDSGQLGTRGNQRLLQHRLARRSPGHHDQPRSKAAVRDR